MKKMLFLMATLVLLVPSVTLAATFRSSDSNTTTLSGKETVKNAYLAGDSIVVNGSVLGDLVAAGKTLVITGPVEDNLNAVGNSITINGQVGKSIRAAGAHVTVNSNIGSDLLAAGGTISLGQQSTVNDDVALAGGVIDLSGNVNGKAYLAGSDITLNGKINGDVIIRGGDKITLGDNAIIGGNFDYQSIQAASIAAGAKINGTTNFVQVNNPDDFGSRFMAKITGFSLGVMLASFLLLLILVYVFPKLLRNVVGESFKQPWQNIGVGFISLVVVPVAAFIAMLTVIGLPIGFLTLGIYLATLVLSKLLVPILIGSLIFKWFGSNKNYRLDWLSLLVGVVATFILGLLPIIGWLAYFAVYLIALSQFARGGLQLVRSQK